MRFLNTATYKLTDEDDPKFRAAPRYAILSHRWVAPEITFQTLNPADLMNRSLETPQLKKIRGACDKARQENPPVEWLWIDTCCINKTNAVEETRSINSMFEWYGNAAVCYAYLYDVHKVDQSQPGLQMFKSQDSKRKHSEWFERGWTLQELLSPRHLEFYDRDWRFMGTKKDKDMASVLEQVTGIDMKYLTGDSKIREASVATRMSWMAGRITRDIEDIAYSMLGIFGITMTLQYGEGKKAFMRLQRTLMETSTDESIFAWAIPAEGLACFRKFDHPPGFDPQPPAWGIGMLAPSPDCFKNSRDVVVIPDKIVQRPNGGYRWTQQGVQFEISFHEKPFQSSGTVNIFGTPRKTIDLPLNCWRHNPNGTPPTIVLRLIRTNNGYKREECYDLEKNQKKNAKPSTNRVLGIDQQLSRQLTILQPVFD